MGSTDAVESTGGLPGTSTPWTAGLAGVPPTPVMQPWDEPVVGDVVTPPQPGSTEPVWRSRP